MKTSRLFALSLSFVTFLCSASANAQLVAFMRDEDVVVGNLADPKASVKPVAKGFDPAISADGTRVAFTQSDADGNRFIAVADVETGKVTRVKGIPGNNAFMPVWSQDGKQLLFSQFMETDWALASVNAEGGGFQVLLDKSERKAGAYGPIIGSKRWLCHDLDGFSEIEWDGKGKVTQTELAKDAASKVSLSMPSRLEVSPDGKIALVDMDVEEESDPNEEGPMSAVYRLEIATGKLTRLTPKGFFAHYPSWLPDGKGFLFGGFNKKNAQPAVYRLPADGGDKPEKIWDSASMPTVAPGK